MAMPDYEKRKILIVDDDSIMREILKGMLRNAGHSIVGEASNGEQVAGVLEKATPEVICLDIHMPKMDGMQCLEMLKATHPHIVVVMISSEATLPVVQGALAKGASGFIVKPFNAAKVLDTIQRSSAKKAA